MPRVSFNFICIAFCAAIVFIVEVTRHLTHVTICPTPKIPLKASEPLNITDLIMDMTRTMIKVEMWNYNYKDSGVDELQDLVLEYGGTPVRSLIVSTWRSGSSFLGELLNAIPSNFYNYEPLMKYGPRQIAGPPHGSNSTKVIKEMLKCNFSGMEKFYFEYSRKIRNNVHQIQINRKLWDKCSYQNDDLCYNSEFVSNLCRLFPFQSIKTVRYRLPLAETILNENELNAKIVLLVRDPRPVLQSRKHFCSGECKNPIYVCLYMEKDYEAAVKFSKKYPDKLMVIRYEDFILNIEEATSQLLKFLRLSRTQSIDEFLRTHTNVSNPKRFSTFRVSRNIPFKWKKVMKFSEVAKIQEVCQDAMAKWGYEPAHNASHMASEDFSPLRPYQFSNKTTRQ